MTGLAVLNGQGRPMSSQELYSFIMKHWPSYRNGKSSSWKSCVRSRLSRPEFFTKLDGKSLLKSVYILNPKNPGWLQEKIQEAERHRLLHQKPLDIYGLEDNGVWSAMIEGCLGLPPFETTDGRIRKRKYQSSEDFNIQNKKRKEEEQQFVFEYENLSNPLRVLSNLEMVPYFPNNYTNEFHQQFEHPNPAPYIYQPNKVHLENLEPTFGFF